MVYIIHLIGIINIIGIVYMASLINCSIRYMLNTGGNVRKYR